MKRRLIIALLTLAMALHGAVPMGVAGAAPAAAPEGSLLAALQEICTGQGVVDHAEAPGPGEDLPHDCKACPAPGQGFAMAPGEAPALAPLTGAVTHLWRVVDHSAPCAVTSSQRTRAPPVFL